MTIKPNVSESQETEGAKNKISSLPRLKLVVAILSAPKRMDRRTGIRLTWMNDCSRKDVLCRFFTDQLTSIEPQVKTAIVKEKLTHGDIEFMPIAGGMNFGLRMLWLMEWSVQNYDFDFFLRIDDDYFLCLRKLLGEIPRRVHVPRLYWGYVHCVAEGQVRVDEGFLILSSDLVKEFVSKKDSLLCHPYGDQAVAIWLNNRTDITRFHDPRVIHDVTAHNPQFKRANELCNTYLSLHGSYLHENLIYWDIVQKERPQVWLPSIQPFEEVCKFGTHFDWRKMGGYPYEWEPKPCSSNPTWNTGLKMHLGRNQM
ncbi:beta-1,3-galactosyltransferase 6-like isoform X2 [Actinia tenebrosa]|uniref:Hexosyltransferase n=1 Tax=Actinia tenebrosa TaxID=6105 RepID=A0A6P8JAF6_ACTTE|nr:beta-1,3-galactosyltransferase 6-like isoform X2 [Actinia tenebrosa]